MLAFSPGLWLAASLFAVGPSVEPEDPAADGTQEGLRGPLVTVSPGVASIPLAPMLAREAVQWSYPWGFSFGYVFAPRPRLGIGVHATFEHHLHLFDDFLRDDDVQLCFAGGCSSERARGSLARAFAGLHVGGGDRVYGFGIVQVGVGVATTTFTCASFEDASLCGRTERDAGPTLGGGAGLIWRVGDDIGLGAELTAHHSWLDARDDPFSAWTAATARLYFAVWLGR